MTFTDEYVLKMYGTEIKTTDGIYNVSDLDYSTRENVIQSLKKDQYTEIVDLKYRNKLTNTEIDFLLFTT